MQDAFWCKEDMSVYFLFIPHSGLIESSFMISSEKLLKLVQQHLTYLILLDTLFQVNLDN